MFIKFMEQQSAAKEISNCSPPSASRFVLIYNYRKLSNHKDNMEQPGLSAMDHAAKDDLIRLLLAEIAELKSRITALEVRLAKDSHDSSKPPSSVGLRKRAPKSMRQAGQHPKGGQNGYKGSALERVVEPDQVILHPLPATCDACGSTLDEAHMSDSRQVFGIPPPQVEVTKHRILEARCTCWKVHRSDFPEDVTATTQYGSRVQAAVVYLTQHHMLPILRTARIMRRAHRVSPPRHHMWYEASFMRTAYCMPSATLGDNPISTSCGIPVGSPCRQVAVVRMIHTTTAGILVPTVVRIGDAVRDARVTHFDEAGMRVAGITPLAERSGNADPDMDGRTCPSWPGGFRRFRHSAGIPGDRHP